MLRRFLIAIAAIALAIPAGPAIAAGDTVFHLLDSDGKGIAGIELWANAGGTSLKIKTDATGTAKFPELYGLGSLRINHCAEAVSSIFLMTESDFNFGTGGKELNIKLPARAKAYEFKFVTSEGLVIEKSKEIAGGFTPSFFVGVIDHGYFKSDLGNTYISSCGDIWTADGKSKAAPFESASSSPGLGWQETITGGTIQKKYLFENLSTNEISTIKVNSFKYIDMNPSTYFVYQRQSVKVTGTYKTNQTIDDLANFTAYATCRSQSGNRASGTAAALDSKYKVTSTLRMNVPGEYKCILSNPFTREEASFAFSINVLPLKSFTAAESKKYKTCALLNHAFEGGLARSIRERDADSTVLVMAAVSAKGYALNKTLDLDKDGIACER